MDLNYINPFIKSCTEIIEKISQKRCDKDSVIISNGYSQEGDYSIRLNMSKDVTGQVYIDIERELALYLVSQMFQGMDVDPADQEFIQSGVKELGNQLVGHTVKNLSQNRFNVEISPPVLLTSPKTEWIQPGNKAIKIGFKTDEGIFSVFLYNSTEKNILPPVTIMTYGIDERLTEELIEYFMPRGVTILKGYMKSINHTDKQSVTFNTALLENQHVDVILIDFDQIGTDLKNIPVKAYNTNTFQKMPIILYSLEKPKSNEFISDIKEYNLIGFLLKRNTPQKNIVSIRHSLINNGGFGNLTRRPIRIKPKPKSCKATLVANQGEMKISSFVTDISVNGVAISNAGIKEELNNLTEQSLERVVLSLEGKLVVAHANLTRESHNVVGLSIKPLNDSYNRTLLKYISESLSGSNK